MAAAPVPAGQDPETQLILGLFPEHIKAAILDALAAAEAEQAAEQAAAAGTQAREDGRGGGNSGSCVAGSIPAQAVQLVEVKVDVGRPLALRLASRKKVQLAVDFGVKVRLWVGAVRRWEQKGGGRLAMLFTVAASASCAFRDTLVFSASAPPTPLCSALAHLQDALAALAEAKGRLHVLDRGGDLFYADNRTGALGSVLPHSCQRGAVALAVRLTPASSWWHCRTRPALVPAHAGLA